VREPGGIEAFTVTAIEFLGGAVEKQADGLYTVLWPGETTGEIESRQLAFDPEVSEEEPDAELVTFASPMLEQIVQRATASGRVAQAFLNATPSISPRTAAQLARSYRFQDASWRAEAGRAWWLPAGFFLFRARYLSDSREEDLVEVGVNLTDGRILRRAAEAIERYGLSPEPPDAWPMMPELPAAGAYRVARGELERKILSPLGRRRRELQERLVRESGRAVAYYDELSRELQEQLKSLPVGDSGRVPLESKLRAIGLEREGRLAELRRKYTLEAEVALLSVLRLYLPRVVFPGRLAGKRHAAELTLVWDPVEQVGEPGRCGRCGGLTYEMGFHRSGEVACLACLEPETDRQGGR
jgi:hypothetical protein